LGIGDWGLGIGDWGLGIGDWAQSPNPQSPIPNPQSPIPILLLNKLNNFISYKKIIFVFNYKFKYLKSKLNLIYLKLKNEQSKIFK
jgi:hypothetical protein